MILGTNRSVSTYRLVNAAGADKTTEYEASATHSGIDVYIEKTKPELDLVLGTKPGTDAFMMYGNAEDFTDIRDGDKVVDNKSFIYFVQGVARFEENDDTDNHLEILLHKERVRYTD